MKEKYIEPQIQIVEMECNDQLLTTSILTLDVYEEWADDGEVMGTKPNHVDVWNFEEENDGWTD